MSLSPSCARGQGSSLTIARPLSPLWRTLGPRALCPVTYDADAPTTQAAPAAADVDMGDAVASSSRARDSTSLLDAREWPLLMRATDGRGKKDTKIKISTTVSSSLAVVSPVPRGQTSLALDARTERPPPPPNSCPTTCRSSRISIICAITHTLSRPEPALPCVFSPRLAAA